MGFKAVIIQMLSLLFLLEWIPGNDLAPVPIRYHYLGGSPLTNDTQAQRSVFYQDNVRALRCPTCITPMRVIN